MKRGVLNNYIGTMGIIGQIGTGAGSLLLAYQHLEGSVQVLSMDGTCTILTNLCCGTLTLGPTAGNLDLRFQIVPLHLYP